MYIYIYVYTLGALCKSLHYKMVLNIRQFDGGPQSCCIVVQKMFRFYRKMSIYGHFSIKSVHFCLDRTQLFS